MHPGNELSIISSDDPTLYERVVQAAPLFRGLEEKLILEADRELGLMYLAYGMMLEAGSDISYRIVRDHLCGSLRTVSKAQSMDGRTVLLERTFYSILDYIDVLNAGFEIDPRKIKDLKTAVMVCLSQLAPDLAEGMAVQNAVLNELYLEAVCGPQQAFDANNTN